MKTALVEMRAHNVATIYTVVVLVFALLFGAGIVAGLMFEKLEIFFFSLIGFAGVLSWQFKRFSRKFSIKKDGWKVLKLMKIDHELERQFMDAGIYFERKIGRRSDNVIWVELPRFQYRLRNNGMTGVLAIQNSVKYNDKLQNIDVSSALGDWVVEAQYLDDTRNMMIVEFELANYDRQLTWNSVIDVVRTSKRLGTKKDNWYKLFVDKQLAFPMQHIVLSGKTGSGKSFALFALLEQMILKRWDVYIADPKDSELINNIGQNLDASHKATGDDIPAIVEKVVEEMKNRKKELKSDFEASDKVGVDYRDFNKVPVVLIVDEYAALMTRLDKETKAKVIAQIKQLVLEGRQLGVFVVLAMQQANAQLLSTDMREQFGLSVVLGNSGEQTYNVMFGMEDAGVIPKRNMKAGEGWYMLAGKTRSPKLLRFPMLNFDMKNDTRNFLTNERVKKIMDRSEIKIIDVL